ncbi:MAG: sigma-70 family RNA polymerase sigma factor [Acidimicrobiia bacterium]
MASRTDQRSRFEEIWTEYRLQILAYCLRRAAPTHAEDACNEVFMVAWRRIDEIPRPPKTVPYLYGIAGKVVSNHRRAFHRRSRLDEKLSNLGVAPATDPVDLVVQNTEDQRVAAAVRNLKPKDQEIVMLHAWEDLSHEEIAEITGMTAGAVRQRIHRSYQHLARVLEPSLDRQPNNSPPIAEEGGT